MSSDKDAGLARDYLLGRLDEHEREAVRERLFSDEDLYRAVLSAEADLMDELASDQLPPSERSEFERHCLASSQQRFKLQLARAMRPQLEAPSAGPSDAAQPVPAFKTRGTRARLGSTRLRIGITLAAGLAGVALLSIWMQRVQSPSPSEEAGFEIGARHQAEPSPEPSGRRMSIFLSSAMLRGNRLESEVEIPSGIDAVILRLEVREPDPSLVYILSVSDSKGRIVFRSSDLLAKIADGIQVVEAAVPADDLPGGTFEAELQARSASGALEPISYSYFKVVRNP